MTQQAMFFERVRRPRKKLSAPAAIAKNIEKLADFYRELCGPTRTRGQKL
jgi:hypothetical protein